MLKSEKETLIKEMADKFGRAKAVILTEFNKVPVEKVNALRKKLRDGGVEYKVLKNTLAKRAAKGTAAEKISDDFVGSVSVCLSYGDVVAPAKILTEFIKDSEMFKVKGAVIEGVKQDANGVKALAKMPGLPELRAKLLGLFNQPATKLLRTVKEPGGALARVINAKATKAA